MNLHSADFATHAESWFEANTPETFHADRPSYVAPSLAETRQWEADAWRAGLAGITWPKAYGGQGQTLREHRAMSAAFGRRALPESVNSIGKELCGPVILTVGTEAQKLALLPRILDMSDIWCQGFSEPEAGSDLARLRTKVTRDGDGWRVSGQKIWTSGAYRSQRCLLLARTGSVEDRHRGLVMFAMPMDREGVRVNAIRSIDGRESFCEVFLDNVWLSDDERLGAPDEGWSAAIRVLEIERATNRMYRAWRFENELTHVVRAIASEPATRGLLDDGGVRRRIAQALTDIDVLKGYVERAVEDLVAGDRIGARGSLMKLHWSENHQTFVKLALELVSQLPAEAGPVARRARERFELAYMFSRAATIYAGSTEVQLDIIAQRILNLPKGR